MIPSKQIKQGTEAAQSVISLIQSQFNTLSGDYAKVTFLDEIQNYIEDLDD